MAAQVERSHVRAAKTFVCIAASRTRGAAIP